MTTFRVRHYPEHLTLQDLVDLWFLLVEDGLDAELFYDGSVQVQGDFVEFMQTQGREFYLIEDEGEPAAIMWLDNWAGRCARIHFCVFRRAHGPKALDIGRFVTDWLLCATGQDGTKSLDVLVGVTPETNRLAIRFIKRLGFQMVGTIPHAVPMADGSQVGAVISYLKENEHGRW